MVDHKRNQRHDIDQFFRQGVALRAAHQRDQRTDQHQQCQKAERIVKQIGRGDIAAVLVAETFQPTGEQSFQPRPLKGLELYAFLAGVVVDVAQYFSVDLPADTCAQQCKGAAQQHPARLGVQFRQGVACPRGKAEHSQQQRAQKQRQIQDQQLAQPVGAQQHRKCRQNDQLHHLCAAAWCFHVLEQQPHREKRCRDVGRVADRQQQNAKVCIADRRHHQRGNQREQLPYARLPAEVRTGRDHQRQHDKRTNLPNLQPVVKHEKQWGKGPMDIEHPQLGRIKPVLRYQFVFLPQQMGQNQLTGHIRIQQIIHPPINDLPGAPAGENKTGPAKDQKGIMPAFLFFWPPIARRVPAGPHSIHKRHGDSSHFIRQPFRVG